MYYAAHKKLVVTRALRGGMQVDGRGRGPEDARSLLPFIRSFEPGFLISGARLHFRVRKGGRKEGRKEGRKGCMDGRWRW